MTQFDRHRMIVAVSEPSFRSDPPAHAARPETIGNEVTYGPESVQ